MDCSKAQELLSAYYDGELSPGLRSSVAEHLPVCSQCMEELDIFRELSVMAKRLADPRPPEGLWKRIESELDAQAASTTVDVYAAPRERPSWKWRVAPFVTAAVIMTAIGVVWITSRTWHAPDHDRQLAADFGEYLNRFADDPDGAQQVLLTKYQGQAVSLPEAARHLGHRPVVPEELPNRYSLDAVYVLRMPDCICVQSLYRRDDGEVFAVFEHAGREPAWFGDRPRITARFNGHPCDVVQLRDRLAASWKEGSRYFTVVGARDLDEIMLLMADFQASTLPGRQQLHDRRAGESAENGLAIAKKTSFLYEESGAIRHH